MAGWLISVHDLRWRQYGKRLRGCVLTRFLWFRTFAHENCKNRLTWKQKVSVSAFCSATCKLLCISCLTEIRVVIFTTLKMPKSLIDSRIRAARPGGSEPPPSLGVRPKLAQKVVEGVFCCSVRVRATKRRRRIFSLGRCHEVTEG